MRGETYDVNTMQDLMYYTVDRYALQDKEEISKIEKIIQRNNTPVYNCKKEVTND